MNKEAIKLSKEIDMTKQEKSYINTFLRTKKRRIKKKQFKKLCKSWGYNHKEFLEYKTPFYKKMLETL
jgi:DNA-binding Xre family transcriptional regulator